jgi:nucleoid-associated protein YgaU
MTEQKDFERRLGRKFEAEESKQASKKKSGAEAMDEMLKKSGLAKNVSSSEKAADEAKAVLATHTVASGDTLSGIAQQYYGSAARDDWMAIYEANKETIGDNPSLIKPGQELRIPKR